MDILILWKLTIKNVSFPLLFPRGGDLEKSINLYGCYEPLLTDKVLEILKPNNVFFDVGAAFGYYGIFSTFLTNDNSIYAFDNNKTALSFLKKNLSINNKNINICNGKVCAKEGEGKIQLDSFIISNNLKRLSLVKIDVEGDELEVLKGALKSINKYKPDLLVEMHPFLIDQHYGKHQFNQFLYLFNKTTNNSYQVFICTNHRGVHRGNAKGWEKVTTNKLNKYYSKYANYGSGNFALHLKPS